MRRVGAGIVTWNVLESALENIRGEVKEMSEVNDAALSTVEEQQTEARQQVSSRAKYGGAIWEEEGSGGEGQNITKNTRY